MPFLDNAGGAHNLRTKQHLINVSCGPYRDAAQIGTAALPPRVVVINNEIVQHIDSGIDPQLLKFIPCHQGLVHTIGNAASEAGGVVVFLISQTAIDLTRTENAPQPDVIGFAAVLRPASL